MITCIRTNSIFLLQYLVYLYWAISLWKYNHNTNYYYYYYYYHQCISFLDLMSLITVLYICFMFSIFTCFNIVCVLPYSTSVEH